MSLEIDSENIRRIVTCQIKEGDILEDRYKVINFQKDSRWNTPSGSVLDLKDEKVYINFEFFLP